MKVSVASSGCLALHESGDGYRGIICEDGTAAAGPAFGTYFESLDRVLEFARACGNIVLTEVKDFPEKSIELPNLSVDTLAVFGFLNHLR